MQKHVIIVAGGTGKRMKQLVPKQFLLLDGKPLLMHTIQAFYNYAKDINIVVVLPEAHIDLWKKLCATNMFPIAHTVVVGGNERFHSVKNGLNTIQTTGIVAVHDGARPLITANTIKKVFAEAEKSGAAIPVVAPKDSLRITDNSGASKPLDRALIKMVQTPQVFSSEIIKTAYHQAFCPLFTDDASVVERTVKNITLVDGDPENIKVTLPEDFLFAEAILKKRHEQD